MSHFFIHRPIFAAVISIVIVIAGAVSFTSLPIAKFPDIAPPTIKVSAVYPGASATTIAETVAAPIEQEVNGVEGMIYMSSNSAADGSYGLTVTFRQGIDLDLAAVLVQNRVAVALSKLPQEVRQQGVTTKKQSTQILQFITLTANSHSDSVADDLFLSNYALNIKDQLSRVDGVGEVQVFGAGEYSMRIWLDANKLKQRSLTTEEVILAIREQNVQVAAGQVGAAPAPENTGVQLAVTTQGRLNRPEQFEKIILRTGDGRATLQLSDVARVELGAKDYTLTSTFNGRPAASIAIYQLPSANAISTAQLVRQRLTELADSRDWPQSISYAIPFDATTFVSASIREVYSTLVVAVLLVVVVIFIFLQDWRATLIPTIAIPVSLVGTFAVMSLMGFSINMLSLFGIVLAIGIVVDDAIVVVENATRHLAEGLPPKAAAEKAMSEITGPVIATTLVLLAVFVPTAFMPGITGQLFRQFALTISAAVVVSTINALTLSPALCGLLLRAPQPASFFGFRWFNSGFDLATKGYRWSVDRLVRSAILTVVAYLGLVIVTGGTFARIPTGFIPEEDQGYLFVNAQLPDAASNQRTDEVMQRLEQIYRQVPGIADSVTISGYSLLGGNAGSNLGFSILILEPWEKRETGDLSVQGIRNALRKEFSALRAGLVFSFTPPAIDGLGAAGGFQMEVLDQGGAGYTQLQDTAAELAREGNTQSGLLGLNSTFRAEVPQVLVDVDRTKAKTMGIALSSIYGTLQAYLGSVYINDFHHNNRLYQVRAQADPKYRATADDIRQLEVRNGAGEMVPLASVVSIDDTLGPTTVRRFNLFPAAAINGSAAPGFSSGQALRVMESMADAKLPSGFGYQWTGMAFQEKLSSQGQLVVLALAVVFVFLVLAAQYESWTSPAVVIAIVPLAAVGVVVMLLLFGADNNTYTQVGLVLLVGLASKNAILIVEFASELRKQGHSIREAAVNASALRFRAILMTSVSGIFGFLPLAVATGAGAASRRAVGNVLIGGMIAATVFSLLFVGVFFYLLRSASERR
ncbi:MAG: multidrug efflux RND transporter permease subunit [Pirellulaceae bacterium]|nr:multidrug efflux RND transporter permease subunit [Pirellulaceae bacterium]